MRILILSLFLLLPFSALAADQSWPEQSAQLLRQAQSQKYFKETAKLHPAFLPTSDGKSFLAVWTPSKTPPRKWIVSLPGTGGYATRDLQIWAQHLNGENIGIVVLQWWLGGGDKTSDYYSPFDIYRELDIALNQLHIAPGQAMLHGFSRGSANIYAVAAIDQNKGRKYFNTIVANSGGASMDYPPTQLITRGEFGPKPFAGTQWVTSCGMRDENPDRDGCPAMKRTAKWIESMGGNVALQIEDPAEGHGALHRNPANTKHLLDWYLAMPKNGQ
ncbi:MAG: hypothetical protein EYC62_03195 [Alphaproteobacteria bacterium]|nr:MAG: hypothetical protein EYC62_03195 [Alphaproteobacteria bacterium]